MAVNFGKGLMKAVLVHQRKPPNDCTCSALKALLTVTDTKGQTASGALTKDNDTDKKHPIADCAAADDGAKSKEPPPSGALTSANDGDSEKKPMASSAVTHDGENAKEIQAGSTAVLCKDNLSIGMQVRTVSGVSKDELHDKKAIIETLNKASLWVRFLEGPKKNDTMKRYYSQIKLYEPVPAVTPAGMQSVQETQEPDAKMAKGCEAAMAIFKNSKSSGSVALSPEAL